MIFILIQINRHKTAGIFFYSAIALFLAGCMDNDTPKSEALGFTHGVASGDPYNTSVLLWTRFVPKDSMETQIAWEISIDSLFTEVVTSATTNVGPSTDFCVSLNASGLLPGTTYFYRFSKDSEYSVVGRTKTLPDASERIKIGVVNCAKYTGGYYHAYDALSKMDDVDVVIHLGDYIYENGASIEGSSYWPAFLATGRQHDPLHNCYSLEDYRTRYSQYRGDPVLQKLHARFAMIPVWDDHEIAMGELKKVDVEEAGFTGTHEERKSNSIIAYHEWLPIRPKPFEEIYRSFQFGDLVNLLMLDTRVCCKSSVDKTMESLKDTTRHIVGDQQLQWIQDEVLEHKAHWNVFGNQLLLAKKDMGWERWPGFPQDRNRFLQFVEHQPKRNFVFTTGNAHNPHHYTVFNETKTDTLIHEFLPGSISSGNNAEKALFDPVIMAKEDKRLREAENVLWFNQYAHGFIVLDVTPEKLDANWYFVSSIREKNYELSQPYSVTLRSNGENEYKIKNNKQN